LLPRPARIPGLKQSCLCLPSSGEYRYMPPCLDYIYVFYSIQKELAFLIKMIRDVGTRVHDSLDVVKAFPLLSFITFCE
jgi:hypothetical protein